MCLRITSRLSFDKTLGSEMLVGRSVCVCKSVSAARHFHTLGTLLAVEACLSFARQKKKGPTFHSAKHQPPPNMERAMEGRVFGFPRTSGVNFRAGQDFVLFSHTHTHTRANAPSALQTPLNIPKHLDARCTTVQCLQHFFMLGPVVIQFADSGNHQQRPT